MEIDNYSVVHTASSGHGFIEYLRGMWISFTNNLPPIAFPLLRWAVWARTEMRWKCCSIRFVKQKTHDAALRVWDVVQSWFMSLWVDLMSQCWAVYGRPWPANWANNTFYHCSHVSWERSRVLRRIHKIAVFRNTTFIDFWKGFVQFSACMDIVHKAWITKRSKILFVSFSPFLMHSLSAK